jgi:hypothetical protein
VDAGSLFCARRSRIGGAPVADRHHNVAANRRQALVRPHRDLKDGRQGQRRLVEAQPLGRLPTDRAVLEATTRSNIAGHRHMADRHMRRRRGRGKTGGKIDALRPSSG